MPKETTMSVYLSKDDTKKYLNTILGDKERVNQFITSLTSLAGSSESLKNCDRNSLLACALKATSMGLPFDPNLGFAWAVPYGNVATFQIGAKGYIQLALRTGQYRYIGSRDVREGEFLGRNFVGDPEISWLPDNERKDLKIIGYMAGIELINGFRKVVFWTIDDVETHAQRYSQSYRKYKKSGNKNDAIWALQFDKMAEKTLLKLLISKYGIISTDMQQAVVSDQSKINIDLDTGEENIEYIDNPTVLENDSLTDGEQQKLLQKHGGEKIEKILEKMKIPNLDKLKKSDLEAFEKYLKEGNKFEKNKNI